MHLCVHINQSIKVSYGGKLKLLCLTKTIHDKNTLGQRDRINCNLLKNKWGSNQSYAKNTLKIQKLLLKTSETTSSLHTSGHLKIIYFSRFQ